MGPTPLAPFLQPPPGYASPPPPGQPPPGGFDPLGGPTAQPITGIPIRYAGPTPDQRTAANQVRDDRRRQNTAIANAVKQTSPSGKPAMVPNQPAPQPSEAGAGLTMPLPKTPVPVEQVPQFTPATYQPPKRGLEYLAAGLALLFPGAPIARLAAGFAGGLEVGAERSYERREQQAEQQYNVAQAQAQAAYNNQVAQRQAEIENNKIIWENGKDLRAHGLNPLRPNPDGSYQPFQYPSLEQVMPRVPKGHDAYAATMAGYGRLLQMAERNGDDGAVTRVTQEMADYQQTYKQQIQTLAEWQRTIFTQTQENQRSANQVGARYAIAGAEISAANARTNAEISSRYDLENRRENFELTHDQYKAILAEPKRLADLKVKAVSDMNAFNSELRAARTGGKFTAADGTTQYSPAIIPDQMWPGIQQVIGRIFKSPDPAAMAKHFADRTEYQPVQSILEQAGQVAEIARVSRGYDIKRDPTLLGMYFPGGKTTIDLTFPELPPEMSRFLMRLPMPIQARITGLPMAAQSSIADALSKGNTIEQIRSIAQQHGLTDVVRALGGAGAALKASATPLIERSTQAPLVEQGSTY